ncbi:MAG: leucine-rich repeat protein [Prevotella sp.]|nr:leucine-rich repeat protein [Prevotella sp.]
MKKLTLLIITLGIAIAGYAQDVIYLIGSDGVMEANHASATLTKNENAPYTFTGEVTISQNDVELVITTQLAESADDWESIGNYCFSGYDEMNFGVYDWGTGCGSPLHRYNDSDVHRFRFHVEDNAGISLPYTFWVKLWLKSPYGYEIGNIDFYRSKSDAPSDDNTEVPDIDLTTGAHFTVNLPEAGTLKQRLTSAVFTTDYDLVDFLTIKGKMGGADIAYLNKQEGLVSQLQYLDLSDVELVYDDEVYLERTYQTNGGTYGGIQTYQNDIYTLSAENKDEAGPNDNYGTAVIVTSTYRRRNDLEYAFNGMKHLKQIKLPKTQKAIGARILSGVENLEKVTLPTAPTHIGDYAFGGKALKGVNLPESVESLGKYALKGVSFRSIDVNRLVQLGEGCLLQTNITSAQLSSKITNIPAKAFAGCKSLMSVVIPGSVVTVEEAAFAHSGVNSLTINEGVKKIGKDAFTGCPWLTDVTVANTIEEVGYNAFSGRDMVDDGYGYYFGSEEPTIWLDSQPAEDGVKYIGKVAYLFTGGNEIKIKEGTVSVVDNFIRQSAEATEYSDYEYDDQFYGVITTITLPSTLRILGDECFVYLPISSITLPDALEKLGKLTFCGCSKLSRITIPANVTYLGERTFEGSGLIRVNYNAIDAPYPYIDKEWGRSGYPDVFPESVARVIIGEGVKHIPAGLFSRCKNITRVQMPSTVESIGAYAFNGCTSLESIDLPSSLKEIGTDALICGNLQTVISYLKEPFALTTPTIVEYTSEEYDEEEKEWHYYPSIEVICYTPFGHQVYTYHKDDPDIITYHDSKLPLLKVPCGSLAAYQNDPSWASIFEKIEEFESASDTEAIAESSTISVSQSVTDETDLSGSIVDGIYVTLDTEDSGDGYNADEGCLIINSITTEEGLTAATADDADDLTVKNLFNGLIFEVPAGTGKIIVDCQTLGQNTVYEKIGNAEPKKVFAGSRQQITVPYDVEDDTHIYVYAAKIPAEANSIVQRAAYANDDAVKLYGMTIQVDSKTAILGDANRDGQVNVTDIVATVNYIMVKPSADFNFKNADVNKDGEVNVTDIVGMVNIIMKGSTQNAREAMSVLRRSGFIF